MAQESFETLGDYVESWVQSAPTLAEVDSIIFDAQTALLEAGMVQFNPDGWDFKLHEKYPEAPKSQFKLMVREATGVNTDPSYYDRFVLPSVLTASKLGQLDKVHYVLGYPNAGTAIAAAFVRQADSYAGIKLEQLQQAKVINDDGTRKLGSIKEPYRRGVPVLAVDDTVVGGDTKIEGFLSITTSSLGYSGLSLLVERDPLGTERVRQDTSARVDTAIHWLTLIEHAGRELDLPKDALQRARDYPKQLLEWNVKHDNIVGLPDPRVLGAGNF